MELNIQVKGEPDIPPIRKTFHYEKNDEIIFYETIKVIKNKVERNLRLNINETIALLTWVVVSSLEKRKTSKEIHEISENLLSPNQVLIGVPELLKKVTISGKTEKVPEFSLTIESPIPSEPYFLQNSIRGE